MDYIVKTATMRPDSSSTASVDVNVKDRHRVAQEHQKALGACSNIIHTAETLLGLTAALKQQLLLNDFATLNAGVNARATVLQKGMDSNRDVVKGLQAELAEARRKAKLL
ncbi:hypothetical protein HDU79_010621 [Rhizoclosmatium sp. JEL0117]|nr:hypothetical protein HDU79_010621 [Rhizoclosmatium sp. JEL0117]